MRELDELLGGFLEGPYDGVPEIEKAAFRALLELPDPELIGYLLGDQMHSDPQLANVIETIRSRPKA